MARKRRPPRRPRVELDCRGQVATHGFHRPERAIIHDTESHDHKGLRDLQGIVNYWSTVSWGPGAQVIIDKDGNSCLCADPNRITYHTQGRNTGSFGIELIGFARFTPKMWWLRVRQLNKCAKWLAWLNLEYGVPLEPSVFSGVSRHVDNSRVFGGTHWDPGPSFPFKYVLRKARVFREKGWQ